jgi:MoaA/NifB/PqqE/SkfB family radical SAM enzyme
MIDYKSIRDVHLEMSTLCNAACPWCPRNFWGYPFNGGYPEINLTLGNATKIFTPEFLKQLRSIRINGNFGDIVMNPDGDRIVEYFRSQNSKLNISISTNGSARNREFWESLAESRCNVTFALDGLEDTHYLYRQNTSWKTIIKNATIFIDAGGIAEWKMIKFKHNLHQIDVCRKLSQELGFSEFTAVDLGRNTAPVFDKNGNLSHVLGDYNSETSFEVLFYKKNNDDVLLEDIEKDRIPKAKIICETKKLRSIYIAANGDVSPCCFTGFYPKTYGKGQYHQAANEQLKPLLTKNNALEYSISECINWFKSIEDSWKIQSYSNGRLIICDDNCGISQ